MFFINGEHSTGVNKVLLQQEIFNWSQSTTSALFPFRVFVNSLMKQKLNFALSDV